MFVAVEVVAKHRNVQVRLSLVAPWQPCKTESEWKLLIVIVEDDDNDDDNHYHEIGYGWGYNGYRIRYKGYNWLSHST